MSLRHFIELTRLNRPIGIWLLFLPCLFGIFFTLKKVPDFGFTNLLWLILLFFAGSVVMRSAGCIINDLFDQKFDEKVARTKMRPLAAKKIKRRTALILLAALLVLGFFILLQFNPKTIISGFVALALVILYPLMKRITHYPQVFLGLVFNFGIPMSSLAMLEKIDLNTFLLYLVAIIWTVIYDTIYAFQDIEDDLKIGVKSTAIKFSKNPKKILILLSLAMFIILIFVGWRCNFRSEFFLTILLVDLFLNHKIQRCDFSKPENCLKVFKSNLWVGVLILIAIILG